MNENREVLAVQYMEARAPLYVIESNKGSILRMVIVWPDELQRL